jgi:hypothetical protein
MNRQNQTKAIKLTEELIKDLQKLAIQEKGVPADSVGITILRLREILDLIR